MNNKLKLKIGRVANVVIVIPINVPAWAKDKNFLIKNNGYQIGYSDYYDITLARENLTYLCTIRLKGDQTAWIVE